MIKPDQIHFRFTRFLTPTLLGATLLISTMASAIDAAEVQLDKLSPHQLEQAADAGDPDAQYALGYMYYYGNGVPQDSQKALNWIKRASVQGQEQAIKALELMQPAQAVTTQVAANSTATTPPTSVKPPTTTVAAAPVTAQPPATAPPAAAVPASTTQTKPQTPNVASGADYLSAEEQHLLGLPGNYYTVQVLGSYHEKDVVSYIDKYNLKGKVAYYRSDNNGKDWYVVLYGLYESSSEAKAVIPTLPEGIQKQKPWVKSLSSVQNGIKKKQA